MEALALSPVLLLGIFFCLMLVPLARSFAVRVGLVDSRDGRRKMPGRVVAVTGGLAVFASMWLVIGLALLTPNAYQESLLDKSQQLLGLFLGNLILVLVGVADDFGYLRGRHK